MTLTTAKLSRPRMRHGTVRRPRLFRLLDAGLSRSVTLVCAGPGWGKSMTVSAWAGTKRVPIAWMTVDGFDNDRQIFWSHVLAALRSAAAVPPGSPLAELASVPAEGVDWIRVVAEGLNGRRAPAVLILDDFQEIKDAAVTRELAALLRYPRRPLHLVLISRSEPALPLHRLRTAGELVEIRENDLAFTSDEAQEMLAGQDVRLPPEDVATLLQRTEGWAVGLRLAAGFLAGTGDGNTVGEFRGDLRAVEDYLAHEVLDRQPPGVREFLLYTSICEPVCGDLADAITMDSVGQATLERLERVNHFLVRLGARPQWFRYHPMMRDLLQHRLSEETPVILPQLHRRAAGWYAAHDAILEALEHAVAARDWQYVGQLVVHAAPLIVSAQRTALARILQQVPAAEFASTAEMTVCGAILMFGAGDYDGIPERLAWARELLDGRADADRSRIEIVMAALEVAVKRADGDMPALIAGSTRLLALLTGVRFAELSPVLQYRAIALNNKGVGLLWTGRPEEAERFLSVGATAARAAGVGLVEINAIGHLGLLEVMSGSVREADRLAAGARDLADRRGWGQALQAVPAHLAAALVELERLDLARADRAVRQGMRAHRGEPEVAQWTALLGTQARLALARQDPDTARALLDEARPELARRQMPGLDRWLRLTESEADLMSGRPERVQQRYAQAERTDELSFRERVYLARAAFATRDVRRAEALLRRPGGRMPESVATVEARILDGLVADTKGNGARAADLLAEAVELAARERILRPFLSMGGGRLDVLLARQAGPAAGNGAFVAELLEFVRAGRKPSPSGLQATDLSEREIEVLRYLPTMLTAADIAGELYVSVNTIRAHMRSIYRKLGAARRRDVVARAQERGLL